jgi:hypothetical protein
MTLRDRLIERIKAEQAEVDRIKADAIANVRAAQERIAVLQATRDALTPDLESLIAKLAAIGVKVLE